MPKTENIIIPSVFNIGDESRFIVMEYLEGVDGFSVPEKDKEEYAYLLYTVSMTMMSLTNVTHTDMHPGNLIFMKDYTLGVIDFGMWIHVPDHIRKTTLINLSNFACNEKINGFEHLAYYFEPCLNKDILTEEQYDFIRQKCDAFCLDVMKGFVSRETITEFKNMICDYYPQEILLSKHGLNIIISIAMANSIVSELLNHEKDKIGKIQMEVFKHLVS
jgi:hypothetical protein